MRDEYTSDVSRTLPGKASPKCSLQMAELSGSESSALSSRIPRKTSHDWSASFSGRATTGSDPSGMIVIFTGHWQK